MRLLQIRSNLSTEFHPQRDAQSHRRFRTFLIMLQYMVSTHKRTGVNISQVSNLHSTITKTRPPNTLHSFRCMDKTHFQLVAFYFLTNVRRTQKKIDSFKKINLAMFAIEPESVRNAAAYNMFCAQLVLQIGFHICVLVIKARSLYCLYWTCLVLQFSKPLPRR